MRRGRRVEARVDGAGRRALSSQRGGRAGTALGEGRGRRVGTRARGRRGEARPSGCICVGRPVGRASPSARCGAFRQTCFMGCSVGCGAHLCKYVGCCRPSWPSGPTCSSRSSIVHARRSSRWSFRTADLETSYADWMLRKLLLQNGRMDGSSYAEWPLRGLKAVLSGHSA